MGHDIPESMLNEPQLMEFFGNAFKKYKSHEH